MDSYSFEKLLCNFQEKANVSKNVIGLTIKLKIIHIFQCVSIHILQNTVYGFKVKVFLTITMIYL